MMRTRPDKHQPYHHGDLRRALIDAALALVTEEQDWDFSLREVARRAGVSHNAPYNHFPEKRNLLGAIAAAGFERLRDGLLSATAGIDDAEAALISSGRAYVRLGIENPALYRLMFGPVLTDRGAKYRPAEVLAASVEAKGVLQGIIRRGGRAGTFAIAADSEGEIALAALALWSSVHGLTLLIIDGLVEPGLPIQHAVESVVRLQSRSLRPDLVWRVAQPATAKPKARPRSTAPHPKVRSG
jgi:AcrR family transcriptional regulator